MIKQFDLFKQPIKIRTERSTEGNAWDEQGGSFVGVTLTLFIFICAIFYSVDIYEQQKGGLLDIFSSQEIVNSWGNDTNNLPVHEFNFMPSVEIALLRDA